MKIRISHAWLIAQLLLSLSMAGMAWAQAAAQPAVKVEGPGYGLADTAYKEYARGDYADAARDSRHAVALETDNRAYQRLLLDSLVGAKEYAEAEQVATQMLGAGSEDAALLAQRGSIRRHLGKNALAIADFDAALHIGSLPLATNISMLLDSERKPEARQAFDDAQARGALTSMPQMDVAYLALRVDNNVESLAAFKRADAAGQLPNAAYLDAGFAAVHARQDAQGIAFFERSIADADAGRLGRTLQQVFETRRAVSEVSREFGTFASLTYYRGAVSGFGLAPGAAASGNVASWQAGIESYWRFQGYQDGRYSELFARGFETLYSQDSRATGGSTLTTGVGIRKKPFKDINLVVSASRVFAPSNGRDDWLAQIGYSGGNGGDLRVDVPAWWTTRVSAEVGRYFAANENYGLVHVETGRSFRLSSGEPAWVVFPHLSVAADYDSSALQRSSAGIGPGVGLRYWFRGDTFHAPRSYVDTLLQYRQRIDGAERAKGVFFTTTLSY